MVKQLYVGCVRLEWYVKMPGRFERRSLRLAARSVTVRFEGVKSGVRFWHT